MVQHLEMNDAGVCGADGLYCPGIVRRDLEKSVYRARDPADQRPPEHPPLGEAVELVQIVGVNVIRRGENREVALPGQPVEQGSDIVVVTMAAGGFNHQDLHGVCATTRFTTAFK